MCGRVPARTPAMCACGFTVGLFGSCMVLRFSGTAKQGLWDEPACWHVNGLGIESFGLAASQVSPRTPGQAGASITRWPARFAARRRWHRTSADRSLARLVLGQPSLPRPRQVRPPCQLPNRMPASCATRSASSIQHPPHWRQRGGGVGGSSVQGTTISECRGGGIIHSVMPPPPPPPPPPLKCMCCGQRGPAPGRGRWRGGTRRRELRAACRSPPIAAHARRVNNTAIWAPHPGPARRDRAL
jgi:hypothetical protein